MSDKAPDGEMTIGELAAYLRKHSASATIRSRWVHDVHPVHGEPYAVLVHEVEISGEHGAAAVKKADAAIALDEAVRKYDMLAARWET